MAFGSNGGGLFSKPADEGKKSVEELEREVAVLQEKKAALEAQQKIQRDAYLQLNQSHAETQRMNRELLNQQLQRQHPQIQQQAPAAASDSDNWANMVNSLGGHTSSAPQQQQPAAITPETLKQAVRTVIAEEDRAAINATTSEKQFLVQKANEFKVQYPDLASNETFTVEADRVYQALRQAGVAPEQAWASCMQEAAHICSRYSPRRQQQQKQEAQQGQQMVPGHQYMFPMGMTGAGGGSGKKDPSANMIIDMRPPEERFKEASLELSRARQEKAEEFFGKTPGR